MKEVDILIRAMVMTISPKNNTKLMIIKYKCNIQAETKKLILLLLIMKKQTTLLEDKEGSGKNLKKGQLINQLIK